MKKRIFYAGVAFFLLMGQILYGCSKSSDGRYSSSNNNNNNNNTTTSPNSVSIPGMSFSPGTLSVKTGTTVTWTNNDYTTHTVTSDDGVFNSGDLGSGKTFSYKFDVSGTFKYHCIYHTMTGSVVVSN